MSSSSDSDDQMPRKRKRFAPRKHYDEDPKDFKERYRLTPRLFDLLYAEIGPFLERETRRSHALSGREVLLAALRFYASGHFYYSLGDCQGNNLNLCIIIASFWGAHKTTLCNAVREVTTIINQRLGYFIGWPTDPQDIERARRDFQSMTNPGIPNICGVMDGSHVKVVSPSENEYQFVNRYKTIQLTLWLFAGQIQISTFSHLSGPEVLTMLGF